MGGPRLNIDVAKMTAAIIEVDSKGSFRNWSEMQKAVANSPYGREVGITAPNVYNFITKNNVKIVTPRGKRGAFLAEARNAPPVRISRAKKWKDDPNATEWLAAMRQEIEGYCRDIDTDGSIKTNRNKLVRARKILDKAEQGSVKALIAVNCIGCTAFETAEIRNCECTSCPFYMMRPWKSGDNDASDVEVDDVPVGGSV